MEYILADKEGKCFLCDASKSENDREVLVVTRRDKVFALLVKFTSYHTSTGQGSVTLTNTSESHLATLDFSSTVVPEPVSLAIMGLGLVGTAWMRRMRR